MGRVVHEHGDTSVIVFVVHGFGVMAREAECDAPIAADVHGPCTGTISTQLVQPKPGQIHILWLGCGMQPAEDKAELLRMVRPNPGTIASLKEPGQSLVLEAPDHTPNCNPTCYRYQQAWRRADTAELGSEPK